MKLRILYLVHSIPKYEKSGTPFAVWKVATKLREKNKNIDVGFIIPTPDGSLGKEVEENISIYKIKRVDFHDNFFHDFKFIRNDYIDEIESVVRDFKPNVLHIYNFVFSSYQALYLKERINDLKIVRSITHTEDICFCVDPMINFGDEIKFCNGPKPTMKCAKHYEMIYGNCDYPNLTKWIGNHLMYVESLHEKYVDKIIFTTTSFKDHIIKYLDISDSKIEIISHGIDKLNKVSYENDEIKKLCFIGGTNERKGLGILIDAIYKQPSILNEFTLQVMGNLAENETHIKLKQLKKKYKDKIDILGLVDEQTKKQTMEKADLVILPTYFETYNLVLREVLSLGTPVITTYMFGADIIKDGVNGFKFNVGDSNKLAELLSKIANDKSILPKLREGVEHTYIDTLEDECAKLLEVYKVL